MGSNLTREKLVIIKLETEVLGSRLKQWNLLQKNTKLCFPNRSTNLASFYLMEGGICFCADVDGLTHEIDKNMGSICLV